LVDILTRTKKSLSYILLPAVAAFLLLSGPGDALAQELPAWRDDPLGKRFLLGAGSFWARLDTQVRLDSSSGQTGTEIDFESTLGMDENDVLPLLLGYYRFAKKHRLAFAHFRLNREGEAVSGVRIRFGDQIFPANLPLSSYFDVEVVALSYAYSLIHDKKKELALNIGLQFQDIETGISGNLGPSHSSTRLTRNGCLRAHWVCLPSNWTLGTILSSPEKLCISMWESRTTHSKTSDLRFSTTISG
jgi:hypothetical protein